jgi:hypothetical protein
MAAQKAVRTLSSKGLLSEHEMDVKLEGMREEAGNHQRKLEQLVQKLSDSLDSSKIQEATQETEQKASKMMKTYLGEDPDTRWITIWNYYLVHLKHFFRLLHNQHKLRCDRRIRNR